MLQFQDLVRGHQPDLLFPQAEMLAPLQRFDRSRGNFRALWMRASGKANGSPPISTSRVRATESVSGNSSWKRVPLPACDEIDTRPPTSFTIVCTASSPTPRPEISETDSFSVKPGRKRNSNSSASVIPWVVSGVVSRRSTTAFRTASGSTPQPSSATVISSMPAW